MYVLTKSYHANTQVEKQNAAATPKPVYPSWSQPSLFLRGDHCPGLYGDNSLAFLYAVDCFCTYLYPIKKPQKYAYV